MPNSNPTEIVEKAVEALGIVKLVPAVYQDLLQPAAKEVGQQLVIVAKSVKIALLPINGLMWGYDRISEFLSAKVAARLSNKPPGEITPPNPVIAGLVIMGMVFASEAPHLREMYANLLAAAMHSPSVSKAHPSFVQIIQQLSSVEAQILQLIGEKYKAGEVLIVETLPQDVLDLPASEFMRLKWYGLCSALGVEMGSLSDAYYNNLIRLGILIERTETESKVVGVDDDDANQTGLATTIRNSLMLTDYGDLFLDVCAREN